MQPNCSASPPERQHANSADTLTGRYPDDRPSPTEEQGKGGDSEKRRYFVGPFEDPADGPKALMGLEAALDDLKSRFEDGDVGDELTYRIVELTDGEVEKLPEL